MQVAHASDDVEAASVTAPSEEEVQKMVQVTFNEIMQQARKRSPGSWFGIVFAGSVEPEQSEVEQAHAYAAVAQSD